MKRGLALFLAALLTALALTACGGGGGGGDSAAASGEAAATEDAGEAGSYWGFNSSEAEAPADAQMEEGGEEENRLTNAKMIYTANVEAETMDFDACAADLESLVVQMGGYMEYASAANYGDGYRTGNYTVRVPADQFEVFLKSVGDIGHVVSQDKSAENISEAYYDAESRLVTQKTKLERLQALLAKAENMEDIITLESAIAETELKIEQLTGSLRHYDALVDYASIRVCLREVGRLSTVEEAPPTFLSRLGSAFTDGLRGFGDFLQGLAIFLAYNWTWLVLLALIAAAVAGISRRRRKGQQEGQGEAFRQPNLQSQGFFRKDKKTKNPDDKQPKD